MGKGVAVGLDIGTSGIKLVEVERHKNVKVTRFAVIPLPVDALQDGAVIDHTLVGEKIKELLKWAKIRSRRAVVAINGQRVIVRHIKMPCLSKEELANTIRWEAERYIPFAIEEVNLDYKVIDEDRQANEMDIMLVCAHHDLIQSHLRALDIAGVWPVAMEIQPFALMRGLGADKAEPEGSVALLDIGAGTSDLTIVRNGIPRFTRIIPVAGEAMTRRLAAQLQLEGDAAEKAKIEWGDALYDFRQATDDAEFASRVNDVCQASLKEWTLEVRRALDDYRLQQRSEEIKVLIISGGGSKLKNLKLFLRQELDMIVTNGSFQGEFECSGKLRPEFEEMFPVLTGALGLALREVTEE